MTNTIILVLIAHWVADFLCQNSYMAENKHHNFYALHSHVSTYTIFLFLILANPLLHFDIKYLFYFSLLNSVLHGFIDFFTSKISHKFWRDKNYRMFFITLGFDQLLHQVCLVNTAGMLLQ